MKVKQGLYSNLIRIELHLKVLPCQNILLLPRGILLVSFVSENVKSKDKSDSSMESFWRLHGSSPGPDTEVCMALLDFLPSRQLPDPQVSPLYGICFIPSNFMDSIILYMQCVSCSPLCFSVNSSVNPFMIMQPFLFHLAVPSSQAVKYVRALAPISIVFSLPSEYPLSSIYIYLITITVFSVYK